MNTFWLRVDQLDRVLEPLLGLRSLSIPRGGWLRTLRETLGMTAEQLGRRLGISNPAVFRAEKREAKGEITLNQLKRIANAMECDLVYAVVPRRSIRKIIEDKAWQIAEREVAKVSHSMALEDQQTSSERSLKNVEALKDELLRARWSRLWR